MKTTITSNYGIDIKICCASCANCKLVTTETHRCTLTNEETLPHFTCIAWQVKPKLMNAGMGGGKIRSKQELLKSQEERLQKGILKTNYSENKVKRIKQEF